MKMFVKSIKKIKSIFNSTGKFIKKCKENGKFFLLYFFYKFCMKFPSVFIARNKYFLTKEEMKNAEYMAVFLRLSPEEGYKRYAEEKMKWIMEGEKNRNVLNNRRENK